MSDAPAGREGPRLAALLHAAQATYRAAVADALREAGFGDLPRNGALTIGVVGSTGAPMSEVITVVGLSKQAAGALVDTLVARGYLDRAIDSDDRRRLTITPTTRGRAAANAIRTALDSVDAQLLARTSAEHLDHTRATLTALAAIEKR